MNKKIINNNIYPKVQPIRTICGLYFENDVMKRPIKQAKKSKSNIENISFAKLLEELTTEKRHEK